MKKCQQCGGNEGHMPYCPGSISGKPPARSFVRIGSARTGAVVHLAVKNDNGCTPVCGTRLRYYWKWSEKETIDCRKCAQAMQSMTNTAGAI